jgi:hypothetical protein
MLEYFVKENICKDQLILNGNVDIYKNENQIQIWLNEIDQFIK